jgi:hypothetical protein
MSDLEANKSIVLRLLGAFNDRQLDLLEDVLHPEFRGRGLTAFPRQTPVSDPVRGARSTKGSSKRSPTREATCSTLSRKATRL